MFRRIKPMIMTLFLILIGLSVVILAAARLTIGLQGRGRIYSASAVPVGRVAIVFGAGLTRSGFPTQVLQDRVAMAARLYFLGKVEKLLLSGDNQSIYHDEPGAMRQYALLLGVPDSAIVLDNAGLRTYDTCYRAKAIFGVTSAILVTQNFHLPRALYLCNHLGIEAVGVNSDLRAYRRLSVLYWNIRELFADAAALWDVHIAHPVPVLGNPEPIFH